MTDIVDIETRSRMMAKIRSRNTSPEILIRKALHARGFRFRVHVKNLPGTPDLVMPKYKAVIFIHGCFWHGHGCRYFKIPQTRTNFWIEKITKNQARDKQQLVELLSLGWRVLVIWECAVRTIKKQSDFLLIDQTICWLLKDSKLDHIDEITLKSAVQKQGKL